MKQKGGIAFSTNCGLIFTVSPQQLVTNAANNFLGKVTKCRILSLDSASAITMVLGIDARSPYVLTRRKSIGESVSMVLVKMSMAPENDKSYVREKTNSIHK